MFSCCLDRRSGVLFTNITVYWEIIFYAHKLSFIADAARYIMAVLMVVLVTGVEDLAK